MHLLNKDLLNVTAAHLPVQSVELPNDLAFGTVAEDGANTLAHSLSLTHTRMLSATLSQPGGHWEVVKSN